MKAERLHSIERLENRVYLTVTASVSDGDLVVEGQADGAVEITAVEEGKFVVTDNGVEVATLEGVNDDIMIKLDADGTEFGRQCDHRSEWTGRRSGLCRFRRR